MPDSSPTTPKRVVRLNAVTTVPSDWIDIELPKITFRVPAHWDLHEPGPLDLAYCLLHLAYQSDTQPSWIKACLYKLKLEDVTQLTGHELLAMIEHLQLKLDAMKPPAVRGKP